MNMYFYYVVLFLKTVHCIEALKCFHCNGITHPRFCDHISSCIGNEVCGTQRYLDTSGEVTYNLGCLAIGSCQQKRSGPTPSRTCIECCSKDLCNIEGCGELDHGNRTGLLCHNCKGLLASEKCEHVKECYINEMCFIEEGVSFGESFFTSGCKETHVCPKNIDANPFFGKRTVRGLCSQCCSGDLCNNQCKIGSSTSAPNDEVMGNMFYLTYSVNTVGAQLVLTSIGIARCNLTRSDQSLVKNIVVNGSSIYNINETLNKHLLVFKLHCDLGVILYVVERSISIPGLDAYLVLPTKSLSTQYLVPSYNQTNDGTSGTFLAVISTQSNTSVVIYGKGNPDKTIYLGKDEIWSSYNNKKTDISGTFINASRPVAVYSSIVGTSIDNTFDPFSDMVLPMQDYSKAFIIPNFKDVAVKSVRIYASLDCTIEVYDAKINLISRIPLYSDTKYVEVDNPNMTSIVSSCPSMVHFYSHKTSHQRSFMTLIPGLDQYLSHYYFRTPNYSCSLLLIINKAYISNLRLDESMVSTGMIVEIQEPVNHYDNNAVFTITIDKGRHEAKTTNGATFGLWIYETDNGFAYPAGFSTTKT